MGKKITIAPINGVEIENSRKAYGLMETLYEAKKLAGYNSSSELNKSLETALNEAINNSDALYTALQRRLDIWKDLLCHYYKMTVLKKYEFGEYKSISYIYPYQVINENSTLWLLEVRPDDNYNGGVSDRNYTLDINFDYEVTLEEVTEEEFREQAELSTEHVINRRLKREEDKRTNKSQKHEVVNKDF